MKLNRMTTLTILFAASLLTHAQHQSAAPAQGAKSGADLFLEKLSLSKPVERVNGTVLTQQDLLREMYAIFPYAKQHNGFPKAMEPEIRRGALMMITFEELVYQEALRRKMTVSPQRLATAEAQFKKQFATKEQYQTFLAGEANGSPKVMRQRIKRSLLIDDLLKTEVTSKANVTLAEAKAYYLKNPTHFKQSELYGLQTITIMPPAPANHQQAPVQPSAEQQKQMKVRAEDALRQAKATNTSEEFGLLAEKISEDDYRVMMGTHKPLPPEQLPPEVVKVASTLHPGQMSGLIQAEGAYTIVRLNTHTPARKQTFAEVSTTLRAQLQNQKAEQLRHALDTRLRKSAKIEEL